jgi:hypothetical protein
MSLLPFPRRHDALALRLIRSVWLGVLIGVISFGTSDAETSVSIGIRPQVLQPHERVVGLELHTVSAPVASLPRVPPGWSLRIDNDASGAASVTGSIQVGSATLWPDQLAALIVVAPQDLPGVRFSISGVLHVTSDFVHDRQIVLDTSNLLLSKLPAQ